MKFCKKCGNAIDNGLRFCTKCGTKIENSIEDVPNQYISTPPKKTSPKTPIIIGIIVALLALGAFLGKDSVMYNYYIIKAGRENVVSQSLDYYCKALKIKYSQDVISKIANKVKEDENFEDTLENLSYILEPEDLDKIYASIYVSKAKENYEKNNYEVCRNYLNKAELYGYEVEKFEYYQELVKIEEELAYESSETFLFSNLQNEYIIPDSSTRYLTKDELLSYSKTQLAYIRNEIFARHGYVFENPEYYSYFSSKSWYVPDTNFTGNEEDLNYVEKENVILLKKLEKN